MDTGQLKSNLPELQTLMSYLQDMRTGCSTLSEFLNGSDQAKDYFREIGGIELLLKLLGRCYCNNDAMVENIFLILGDAVTGNEYNRQLLTQDAVYVLMRNILVNSEDHISLQQTTLLFFSSLTANNRNGQDLSRTSRCLHVIVDMFVSLIPVERLESSDTWIRLLEEKPCILWKCMTSALNSTLNNPLNDANQDICSHAISNAVAVVKNAPDLQVVESVANFLGFVVAANVNTQETLANAGGLKDLFEFLMKQEKSQLQSCNTSTSAFEAVLRALHLALKENGRNVYRVASLGIVQHILPYLNEPLPPSLKLQVAFVLTQCVELNEECHQQFINCSGKDIAVNTMIKTSNIELQTGLEWLLAVALIDYGNEFQSHSTFAQKFSTERLPFYSSTAPRQVSRNSSSTDSRSKSEKRSASPSSGNSGEKREKHAKMHKRGTRSDIASENLNKVVGQFRKLNTHSEQCLPSSNHPTIDNSRQFPTSCSNSLNDMSTTSSYQCSLLSDDLTAINCLCHTCAKIPKKFFNRSKEHLDVNTGDASASQHHLQQSNDKAQNICVRKTANCSLSRTNFVKQCDSYNCTEAPLDVTPLKTASNCSKCGNQGHISIDRELSLKHLHDTTCNVVTDNSNDYLATKSGKTSDLILSNHASHDCDNALKFVSTSAASVSNSFSQTPSSEKPISSLYQKRKLRNYIERIDSKYAYPIEQPHICSCPRVQSDTCRSAPSCDFNNGASHIKNGNKSAASVFPSGNVEAAAVYSQEDRTGSPHTSLQNFSVVAHPSYTQQSSNEITANEDTDGQSKGFHTRQSGQSRNSACRNVQIGRNIFNVSHSSKTSPAHNFDSDAFCASNISAAPALSRIGLIPNCVGRDCKDPQQTSLRLSSMIVHPSQNQYSHEEIRGCETDRVNADESLESAKALCKQWRRSLSSILASTQDLVNSLGENVGNEICFSSRGNILAEEDEVADPSDFKQFLWHKSQDKNSQPTTAEGLYLRNSFETLNERRRENNSRATVVSPRTLLHDGVDVRSQRTSESMPAANFSSSLAKDQLRRKQHTVTKRCSASIPRHGHDDSDDVEIVKHLPQCNMKFKHCHKPSLSKCHPQSSRKHCCDVHIQSLPSGNISETSIKKSSENFKLHRVMGRDNQHVKQPSAKNSGYTCNKEFSNSRRKFSVSMLAGNAAQCVKNHKLSGSTSDRSSNSDLIRSHSYYSHDPKVKLPPTEDVFNKSKYVPPSKFAHEDDVIIVECKSTPQSCASANPANSRTQNEMHGISLPHCGTQNTLLHSSANARNTVGNRTEHHISLLLHSRYRSRQKATLELEFSYEEKRLSYYESNCRQIQFSPFMCNSVKPKIEATFSKNDCGLNTKNSLVSMANSVCVSQPCMSQQCEHTVKNDCLGAQTGHNSLALNNKMDETERTSPNNAQPDLKHDNTSAYHCKWPKSQNPLVRSIPLVGPSKIKLDKHYWKAVSEAMCHPGLDSDKMPRSIEITFQPPSVTSTANHDGSQSKPELSSISSTRPVKLTVTDELGDKLTTYECVSVINPESNLKSRNADNYCEPARPIPESCKNSADRQCCSSESKNRNNRLEDSSSREITCVHINSHENPATHQRFMETEENSTDCRQLTHNWLQNEMKIASVEHSWPLTYFSPKLKAVNLLRTSSRVNRNVNNQPFAKDILIGSRMPLFAQQNMPNLQLARQTVPTVNSTSQFMQSDDLCAQNEIPIVSETSQPALRSKRTHFKQSMSGIKDAFQQQSALEQDQKGGTIPLKYAGLNSRHPSIQTVVRNAMKQSDETHHGLLHIQKKKVDVKPREENVISEDAVTFEFQSETEVRGSMEFEPIHKHALMQCAQSGSKMCSGSEGLHYAKSNVCYPHGSHSSLHRSNDDGFSLLAKTIEKECDNQQVSDIYSQGSNIKKSKGLHRSQSSSDVYLMSSYNACIDANNETNVFQTQMKEVAGSQTVMCQVQGIKERECERTSGMDGDGVENGSVHFNTINSISDSQSLVRTPSHHNNITSGIETQENLERNTKRYCVGRQYALESLDAQLLAEHREKYLYALQSIQKPEQTHHQCFQESQQMNLNYLHFYPGNNTDIMPTNVAVREASNCPSKLYQETLKMVQPPKVFKPTDYKNTENGITCKNGNFVMDPENNARVKDLVSLERSIRQSASSSKMQTNLQLSGDMELGFTDSCSSSVHLRCESEKCKKHQDFADSIGRNRVCLKTPGVVDIWSLQSSSLSECSSTGSCSKPVVEPPVDSPISSLTNRTGALSLKVDKIRHLQTSIDNSAISDGRSRVMEYSNQGISHQSRSNSSEELVIEEHNFQQLNCVQARENVLLQHDLKELQCRQVTECSLFGKSISNLEIKEKKVDDQNSAILISECHQADVDQSESLLDKGLVDIANHTLQKVPVTKAVPVSAVNSWYLTNHKEQPNDTICDTKGVVDCNKIWTKSTTPIFQNNVFKQMSASQNKAFCVECTDHCGTQNAGSPCVYQSPVKIQPKACTSSVDDFHKRTQIAQPSPCSSTEEIDVLSADADCQHAHSQTSIPVKGMKQPLATTCERDETNVCKLATEIYIYDSKDNANSPNINACIAPVNSPHGFNSTRISELCPNTESLAWHGDQTLASLSCDGRVNTSENYVSRASDIDSCNQEISSGNANACQPFYEDYLADHNYGSCLVSELETKPVSLKGNPNNQSNETLFLFTEQGTIRPANGNFQTTEHFLKNESFLQKTTASQNDKQIETSTKVLPTKEVRMRSFEESSSWQISSSDMPSMEVRGTDVHSRAMNDVDMSSTELSSANMYPWKISIIDTSSRKMTDADMPSKEFSYAEVPSRQISNVDTSCKTKNGVDMPSREFSSADTPSTEMSGSDTDLKEISDADTSSRARSGADMPSREMTGTDTPSKEMRYADTPSRVRNGVDMPSGELSRAEILSLTIGGAYSPLRETSGADISSRRSSTADIFSQKMCGADMHSREMSGDVDIYAQKISGDNTSSREIGRIFLPARGMNDADILSQKMCGTDMPLREMGVVDTSLRKVSGDVDVYLQKISSDNTPARQISRICIPKIEMNNADLPSQKTLGAETSSEQISGAYLPLQKMNCDDTPSRDVSDTDTSARGLSDTDTPSKDLSRADTPSRDLNDTDTPTKRSNTNVIQSNFCWRTDVTSMFARGKCKTALLSGHNSNASSPQIDKSTLENNTFPEQPVNIKMISLNASSSNVLPHMRITESMRVRDTRADEHSDTECPQGVYSSEMPVVHLNTDIRSNFEHDIGYQQHTTANDENGNIVCVVPGDDSNANRPVQSELANDCGLLHQSTCSDILKSEPSSDTLENFNFNISSQDLSSDIFGTAPESTSCVMADRSCNDDSATLVTHTESLLLVTASSPQSPYSSPASPTYQPSSLFSQVNIVTTSPPFEHLRNCIELSFTKENDTSEPKSLDRNSYLWNSAFKRLKRALTSLKWKSATDTKKTEISIKRKIHHSKSCSTTHMQVLRPLRPRKSSHSLRRAVKFSVVEDAMLRQGIALYGYNWELILNKFDFAYYRTPDQLRNRWRYLVLHNKEKTCMENKDTKE